jgi:hypothetical protein
LSLHDCSTEALWLQQRAARRAYVIEQALGLKRGQVARNFPHRLFRLRHNNNSSLQFSLQAFGDFFPARRDARR